MKNRFFICAVVFVSLLMFASCLSRQPASKSYFLAGALPGVAEEKECRDAQKSLKVLIRMPLHVRKKESMVLFNPQSGIITTLKGGCWKEPLEDMMSCALAESLAGKYSLIDLNVRDFCAYTTGVFVFNGNATALKLDGKEKLERPFAFSLKFKPSSMDCDKYAQCCNELIAQLVELMK